MFPELVLRGQAPVEREEPRDVVDCDDLGGRESGPQEGIVFDEAHFRPGRRLLLPDLVGLSAAAPHSPYLEPAFLLQGVATAAASDGCQPKQMKGRSFPKLSFSILFGRADFIIAVPAD